MGLRKDIRDLLEASPDFVVCSEFGTSLLRLVDAPKKVKCESPPIDPVVLDLLANSKVALFIRNDDSVEVIGDKHTDTTEALVRLGSAVALIHSGAVKNVKH